MIPKIFHFIWISSDFMNEENNYKLCHIPTINSYEKHNPNFGHKIWTNKEVRGLLSEFNDKKVLKVLHDKHTLLAQKTDIIRMIILHKYGGVYVDLDTICIGNFDRLVNEKDCFVGEESVETRSHMNTEANVATDMHYINNCVIGMAPSDSHIYKSLAQVYFELLPKTKNIVRTSYGPKLVETALSKTSQEYFTILDETVFYANNYFTDMSSDRLTPQSLIIHFYGGTSKDGN